MLGWLFGTKEEKRTEAADAEIEYLIDLRDVVKEYITPAGPFPALKGIDLQVTKGEFVAVVGKSGSGKSTLINMITGIDRPTSGVVIVNGTEVENQSEGAIAAWRGVNVGVVFQFFQLLPSLTVLENVMLPMDFCGLYTRDERRRRGTELLESVGIGDQIHKLPNALSGGQQQRVAIARALANDPPVIIADEPTGNLDSRTAGAIFELFAELVEQGKTILMVTHDEEMAHAVTRTITLADGRITTDERHDPVPLSPVSRPQAGTSLAVEQPVPTEPSGARMEQANGSPDGSHNGSRQNGAPAAPSDAPSDAPYPSGDNDA